MTQVFFSKVIWLLQSGSTGWMPAAQIKNRQKFIMTSTANSNQPKRKKSKAPFSTAKARNRAVGHPAEFGPMAFHWTGLDTWNTPATSSCFQTSQRAPSKESALLSAALSPGCSGTWIPCQCGASSRSWVNCSGREGSLGTSSAWELPGTNTERGRGPS